jgi:hypothetical protein
MINLTNKVTVIKNNPEEIKKSILLVKDIIMDYYSLKTVPEKINRINKKYTYVFNINEQKVSKLNIGENFIAEIFNFTMDKNSENIFVKYELCQSNVILERPYLMVAFKMVLLDLWKKKMILLPLSFNVSTTIFTNEIFNVFDNDIIKTIENDFKNKNELSKNSLSQYLPKTKRIIRTTNYKNIKDFSLKEMNKLHVSIMDSPSSLGIKDPRFYIDTFLINVSNLIEVKEYDSVKYKSWLSGYNTRHEKIGYLDYLDKEEELKEYRREYNIRQTIERNKKSRKIKPKTNFSKKRNDKYNKVKKTVVLKEIKELTTEDYFFEVVKKQTTWNKKIPLYEGYGLENSDKNSEIWIKVFKSYIEHRKRNGYESTRTIVSSFNFLMNYIYFYLRYWNKYNNKNNNIPNSPKDFHRTLYINNSSLSSKQEDRPFTISELLEYRYDSEANRNSYIKNIELFFNFIADFFEEESDVWSSSLRNPIRKSDYYREYKTKKTNKVIIPKDIYGKLKKYLYAVEAFGEYLEEKIILNKNFIKFDLAKTNNINSGELGYVPIFYDKGKSYPLIDVPNLFLFKRRKFDENNLLKKETECIVERKMISNTVVRAMILMLNTGLRAAQVSWLDRNTWDINEKNELNAYYKLNVNTDKTKNHEWTTYISNNVYSSLKKETLFQESMRENFIDLPVNYKDREYSRFEDILPLFKSNSRKGLPVNFTDYWVEILWSFQNLINRNENKNYKLITISKPSTINIFDTVEANEYCPLNIKSVHTPHSMRATFCTHMSEYLERSEIAALVGHASDLITSEVYIKPEDSVVMDKISKAVDILDNGGVNSDYFDKESNVHTKPNLKNSSLQKAFSENRDQTIELFNITSISLNINKETELQSQKAINLLKDARMDQVIFETTHICPVGGICPQEVMGAIGEKRRCGLCPLALKCIDNINPIYAKQRDLIREIKDGKDKLELSIKNNESDITLNNIEDKVNLDIRELVSWKFSADILSEHYEQLKVNPDLDKKYYVEMPDMVKKHLTKVSISNEKEYLLTRIADSNAYSAYSNADNKYQAEMIKRNLIKNLGLFEYDDINVPDEDKIEVFCAMMKNMMDTNGVDLKELVDYDCFKSIEDKKEQKKLLFKNIKLLK